MGGWIDFVIGASSLASLVAIRLRPAQRQRLRKLETNAFDGHAECSDPVSMSDEAGSSHRTP